MGIGWFLQQIDDISAIKIFHVNCETALINVLDSAFPKARTAICIRHTDKAVMAKVREILPKKLRAAAATQNLDPRLCGGGIGQETDQVRQLWQSVADAVTEDYMHNLEEFWAAVPSELFKYFDRQWIPHAQQFVACWMD